MPVLELSYDGAFRLGRHLDELALGELAARGMPVPAWDAPQRAWTFPDSPAARQAVAFLAEAGLASLDASARSHVPLGRANPARLAELEAKLRPYQAEGVAFALRTKRLLLADSMGLGKSLQALVAIEKADAYPCIVVCPSAVKQGWRREALKWVPWRLAQVVERGRDEVRGAAITVLNPELMPRHLEDLQALHAKSLVLDEAHFFKNPDSQRSRNALALAGGVPLRLALTGTPIKNRREDLVHQLRILGQLEPVLAIYRGLLPHWYKPGKGPLPEAYAQRVLDALDRKTLGERLRAVCMVRRTKQEVASQLPPFGRTRVDVSLSSRHAYAQKEHAMLDWVRKWQERFGAEAAAMEGASRLQFRHHLSALRRESALAKIAAVCDWAEPLAESGERVVFFAYHKEVVARLGASLPGRVATITGDQPAPTRRAILDALDRYDFLVATMDSTGYGVDGIQLHASQVGFIELDWTPTKHEQCEGRLHRIGQTAPVNSWYFIAQHTIDGAMMEILEAKWADIQGVVDAKEGDDSAFLGEMLRRLSVPRVPA